MYKPKPLTDAELDKFIADLDPDLDAKREYAKLAVERMYKVPVPRLGLPWAIAGACMLIGSLLFVFGWIIPVYQKLAGGIQ